jgi:hypothetical protein
MSKIEKYLIILFVIIAGTHIISAAYLGINGAHAFRQADVYANILGLLDQKNFNLYDLFTPRQPWGNKAIFDFPLYSYLVAKASGLFGIDPLVTVRYINLLIWSLTAYSGFRLSRFLGYELSGLVFISLLASSPLFLHYFSVPLPDNLALMLSLCAVVIVLEKSKSRVALSIAFLLLMAAALIKSPIPFVFIVFMSVFLMYSQQHYKAGSFSDIVNKHGDFYVFLFLCLIATLIIEAYRGRMIDELSSKSHIWHWYFGDLKLRISSDFWSRIIGRFNEWGPGSFSYLTLCTFAASLLVGRGRIQLAILLAACSAFLAGWLIFANVYYVHDYYQLSVAVIIFVAFSVSISSLIHALLKYQLAAKFIPGAFSFIVAFAFLYQFATAKSYSIRTRTDLWRTLEYALRDDQEFLFVTKVSSAGQSPEVGGRVSTKFTTLEKIKFEELCDMNLAKHRSVLVEGQESDCLEKYKIYATYYIADEGIIFMKLPRAPQEHQ